MDGNDQKGVEAFYVKLATSGLEQIAAVRDLGFPEGDGDRLDRDLKASETAFEAQKDLQKYGLEDCGT